MLWKTACTACFALWGGWTVCSKLAHANVFEERPWEIEASLGLGTPVGVAGIQAEYAPVDWFAFQTGGGVSMYGQLQLAAMAHLRYVIAEPISGVAFDLGVGASGGRDTWREFGIDQWPYAKKTWSLGVWQNVEAGVILRDRAFSFRTYAGLATILNPRGARCELVDDYGRTLSEPCTENDRNAPGTVLYLGIAAGVAF